MHATRISPHRRFVRPGGLVPRLSLGGLARRSRSGAVKLRLIVVLLLLGGFVGAAVYATMRVDTEPVTSLVKKMRDTFAEAEGMIKSDPKKALAKYVETEAYAQRILEKEPKSTEGLLYYGQSLVRQERPDEALKYFLQSPDSESLAAAWCHLSAGQILANNHSQYAEAEKQYRRALELQPGEPTATWLLSQVMKVGARDWELIPLELAEIEQRDHLNIQLMNELSHNERLVPDVALINHALKQSPDDPNVLLGQSQVFRVQGKYEEAEASLRHVIEVAPQLDEAHVRLGWVLFESGDDAKFLKWHASVQPSLEDHPLLWSVRGARAQRAHEPEVAARCYWEAIKRDPNLQDALYQLGLLLTSMNRKTEATPFLERAQKLVDYGDLVVRNHLQAYEQKKGDVELSTRAIKAASDLGNLWEAYAWTVMTLDLDHSNKGLENEIKQTEGVLKNVDKKRTLPNFNPASKLDLAKLPVPKWSVESAIPSLKPVSSPVSFADQAELAGIKFQYFDGSDPAVDGLNKMHQINGGGAGVVDFDRDGWPDLYLSQGSKEPQDREQTEHLDRLFRNSGDGHFTDVTAQAHLVENGFSQGVSVGDLDNDGFPDIYVANVGANRLFMNNGDGTFSDASEESGATESQWTTSCVIADMNGDSLPDIYAVGYLEGDALTRVCNDASKHHYPCLTFAFPSARHRLWLNQGDGKFEDATATAQIDRYSDRGTSVIAANLDGSRKLDLLVGNSGTQNYFFKNGVDKPGDPPKFTETSLAQGLALGANGEPRKCLGLAAGDFNGDGLLDFHGTSVTEEPDTLYTQQKGGSFFDTSFASGLSTLTNMRTSFGTQAIDGSLDGKLDLFSSGGNVDNAHSEYFKYEMPPAYFANDGRGQFSMVSAESLGPYFQKPQVGRAVTRLDWNRDGLDDLLVYHARLPVALLTNTTRQHGHHLTIRLVSTKSARDSIGTTVEVVAGGKKIVRQLTAGDGFQASNERALIFGLGANTKVDSIVIHWMSGREQRLAETPGDQEILFVEGRDQPTTLTRD
jgi:tetratricopeptide (TPR) repeat protein